MPTIVRFAKCNITMYADDHLPPHFHVRMNDGREALVEIANLAILRGKISQRELIDALQWASSNIAVLNAKWKELNP